MYVVEGNYKPPNDHVSALYCGITKHVEHRVKTHNAGKGAKAVKGYLPVTLVATWEYPDQSTALKAEYAFKQLRRLEKAMFIQFPEGWDWEDPHKLRRSHGTSG